jgi:hypothetical protein
MPRNPVIENVCDRCTRSWYTPTNEKQAEVALTVNYSIGDASPLTADFKCLCEGCQKTVRTLIESITKVMTKSAPVRGAKKVASEDKTPPATSTTTVTPVSEAAKTLVGEQKPSKPPATAGAPVNSPQSQRPAPNPTRG